MNKEKKHIINEYYYGRFDKLNFAIYERKVTYKGDEKFNAISYYTSLNELIRGMKKLYTQENLINESVEELISNLIKIEEEIKK